MAWRENHFAHERVRLGENCPYFARFDAALCFAYYIEGNSVANPRPTDTFQRKSPRKSIRIWFNSSNICIRNQKALSPNHKSSLSRIKSSLIFSLGFYSCANEANFFLHTATRHTADRPNCGLRNQLDATVGKRVLCTMKIPWIMHPICFAAKKSALFGLTAPFRTLRDMAGSAVTGGTATLDELFRLRDSNVKFLHD